MDNYVNMCNACFKNFSPNSSFHFIDKGHELCCQIDFCSNQCLINYLLPRLNEEDNSHIYTLDDVYFLLIRCTQCNCHANGYLYYNMDGEEIKEYCSKQCLINYLLALDNSCSCVDNISNFMETININ